MDLRNNAAFLLSLEKEVRLTNDKARIFRQIVDQMTSEEADQVCSDLFGPIGPLTLFIPKDTKCGE